MFEQTASAYIYGLRVKGEELPFYVGSTLYPDRRLQGHFDAVQRERNQNKHFVNKLNKVGFDNVEMVILEVVAKKDRWTLEVNWINHFLSSGVKLTNRYHNGFSFQSESIDDTEYQITRETWIAACQERDEGYHGTDPIKRKTHDLLCMVMETIEQRFPEKLAEILGGTTQDNLVCEDK